MKTIDLIDELLGIVLDNHLFVKDAEVLIDGNNLLQAINPTTSTFRINTLNYDSDKNIIYITLK